MAPDESSPPRAAEPVTLPDWAQRRTTAPLCAQDRPCVTGNPKDLIGVTKAPVHLVPPVAIIECAAAFADGEVKYGAYNWRKYPVRQTVYIAAAMRHLLALLDGEDDASDSGVSHEGHVMSCMAVLCDARALGTLVDDRPTPGGAAAALERHRKATP